MFVQNLLGFPTQDGKLALEWELMGPDAHALTIQVATDVEFTQQMRQFVVAPCTGCTLDLGPGAWYYRVGAWLGTAIKGVVDWSPIYGPVPLGSQKGVVPVAPPTIRILSVQPALNSLIFHTGFYEPYYVVVDYTHEEKLMASTAKTVYVQDWGNASFVVQELDATKGYSFRVYGFASGKGSLPGKGQLKMLDEGRAVGRKRPKGEQRAATFTDTAVYAADRVLLREATEKKSLRFSSYADYMQFLAAQARTTGRRERI